MRSRPRRWVSLLVHDVKWLYPRPVTTAAVYAACVLSALLAWALLPAAGRPAAFWVLPAGVVGYGVHRVSSWRGWSKRFKHALVDPLGGDVDDAQTWLVATLVGLVVLTVLHAALT